MKVETIFPLNTELKFSQTRFFSVLMEEVMECENKPSQNLELKRFEQSATKWKDAYRTLEYLTAFLGEVEQRKMFALMCLTPEKLNKLPAGALTKVLVQLGSVSEKLKNQIKTQENANRNGSNKNSRGELSDEERKRIDKALKK